MKPVKTIYNIANLSGDSPTIFQKLLITSYIIHRNTVKVWIKKCRNGRKGPEERLLEDVSESGSGTRNKEDRSQNSVGRST